MLKIKRFYFNLKKFFPIQWANKQIQSLRKILASLSETKELRFRQEPKMDTQVTKTCADDLTLREVDQRIKQATEPVLKHSDSEWDWIAGNCEAPSSRCNKESFSPPRNPCDMMTGVKQNPHRRNRLQRATTLNNLTTSDPEQLEDSEDEPDMTQLMNAISNVPNLIHRHAQKQKFLQTQKPTLKKPKKRYNELKHLLLNNIRHVQNKITGKEKLQFFTNLQKEDAIGFSEWPYSQRSPTKIPQRICLGWLQGSMRIPMGST